MIGHRARAIREGFIPGGSFSQKREIASHEACCILNVGDTAANIELALHFEDREPAGPYRVEVGPRRTLDIYFNDEPEPVPPNTAYAAVIRSDVLVVVERSPLDLRDPHVALLSAIAFPVAL